MAPDGLEASTTISLEGASTVTMKSAELVLPLVSVAEHVTIVIPIENVEPELGVQTGVIAPSTLSELDAEK